jgi:HD-GYP domain-containing protein (c-di-GMP phosphodiesterase class II)
MPMLDGGRLAGVLLVADAAQPYDDDDRRHAEHIADAATKLLRRRRSDAEIVTAMDHMERVMFGAIEALAQLAETQDACKTGRARRVGDYAAGVGTALGLPGHTVRGLRVTGQLIDVGMLQIPRELLWRPGILSASEFELVKTHAERGFEVLRAVEFPWPVAEAVRQHHERLDGSGYPRGLKGEEILLEARIVAVADAVEAMLSPRPHRPALTLTACLDELQSQAGRRYDARVVKACVKLLRDGQVTAVPIHQEGEAAVGQRIA